MKDLKELKGKGFEGLLDGLIKNLESTIKTKQKKVPLCVLDQTPSVAKIELEGERVAKEFQLEMDKAVAVVDSIRNRSNEMKGIMWRNIATELTSLGIPCDTETDSMKIEHGVIFKLVDRETEKETPIQ